MSGAVLNDDGLAVVFDRVTGSVLTCSVPTAIENVGNGNGRFVHGLSGEALDEVEAEALAEAPIPLLQEDTLPLPGADTQVLTAARDAAIAERDTALERVLAAEAQIVTLASQIEFLTAQVGELGGDVLAAFRTEPGDSPEKLAKIEAEVDEANASANAATGAVADPLDHDADGKKGGSKPRAVRTPEEQAEREAVIAELKTKGIKYFAGATTAKLWEVLAAG